MKRSSGWTMRQLAFSCPLVLICGTGLAQPPEQHWQIAPNNSSNNGPSYQPSTAPAANDPAAAAPAAGAYQYQPPQPSGYPPAGGGNPQLPPLDARSPSPAGAPQNGQAGPPGYRGGSPYLTSEERRTMQGPAGQGDGSPNPRIQGPPSRDPSAQYAPQVPFVLSQPEINALENLLVDWEKRNKEIHVLESTFYRWRYDAVFGDAKKDPVAEKGELKFAAPDKAWMKIEAKDPKLCEQWLCDGKSIFQWDYANKVVTEWIMPPEMQGKGIGDGPLPFVFGIEAQKLKQRYFMRILSNPPGVQNEVWLEAYPKYQHDRANYSKVEVILQLVGEQRTLFPFAIQIYAPNGKDRVSYRLEDPKINPRRPIIEMFGPDPWKPSIPFGWSKRTELPDAPAQSLPAGANRAVLPRR